MIVSVTPLGSPTGDAAGAASDVVKYLEGKCAHRAGHDPGPSPDLPAPEEGPDVVGYYADSMASPGIWMGHGFTGVHMDGMVDPAQLHTALLGQNPTTGEQLMTASGSAQRAHADQVKAALRGPDDDLLSLPEAADALGVSASYLRQQAAATQKARVVQARQLAAGDEPSPLPPSHLDATQAGRHSPWKVTRGELRRFAAERTAPSVIIGYDLTFSPPKSVSLLWATANPAQQVAIEAALTDAVRVGIAYLEENAAHVRVSVRSDDGTGRSIERQNATGLVAAAYLHDTSRALDPQLHLHVVAANMAEGPDDQVRALDGRSLFLHAKTAGYLSGAELRNRLTRELGVEWNPVQRGVADIAGVPRAAIVEMSQRSRQMDDHIAAMDDHQPTTAKGRQVAAYDTRAAKDSPVDPDSLRPSWERRMAEAGFDRRAIDACYGRQRGPLLVDSVDRAELFKLMNSADGVTEHAATFDRRDVLQFVAQWAGDRLPAPEIERLADTWLTMPEIVPLENSRNDARSGAVIRRDDGLVVTALERDALYTTQAMVHVEAAITAAYEAGRTAGVAVVDAELVDAVLADRGYLGDDQVAMVRSITSSGQRIQLVQGDAGSGKTTALEAAARAWEAAGYKVIGSAVQGTATELVGDKAKVASATVASILARVATGDSAIGPRTVIVIDECSTLGNRDLYHLTRALESTGASARLIGDPRQHEAVAAGGAWRRLLADYPDDAARVTEVRRQQGEEMEDVRQALAEWRAGNIDAAISLLDRNGRVVIANDRDELMTSVVAEWYGDRQRRAENPDLDPSSMMTEYHRDRRELNALARQYLVEDGTLTGPVLHAEDLQFQAGDEVMALEQDRDLRPVGATRRGDFVHTAEKGVVLEVHLPKGKDPGSLLVDFARRGPVEVPMEYLTRRLDRGVTGALAHSYALTTHAAEGDTYDAVSPIATDATSAKGVYVALTRAVHDVRMHMARALHLDPARHEHAEMPRLEQETKVQTAVINQIKSDQDQLLAREVDPLAGRVAALRAAHSLPELDRLAAAPGAEPSMAQARRQSEQAIAAQARLRPPAGLAERIGTRPAMGPTRGPWDEAVAQVAIYRARYEPVPVAEGPYVSWALGPIPTQAAAQADYQRAGRALLIAEQAGLTQRSAKDLAAERAQLRMAMAPPSEDERREAGVHHRHAQSTEAAAAARVRAAENANDAAMSPLLRRPNPKRVEATAAELETADAAVFEARANVRRSAERLAALQPEAVAEARVPLQQRLERIDGAIADKVADAVATPAPYLTTALGPRPIDPTQRQRWTDAARQLETWRHAELGLTPIDGPLAEDGLAVAIGRPGPDEAQALRQRMAVRQLPIEFQPQRTIDRPIDAPTLTLD